MGSMGVLPLDLAPLDLIHFTIGAVHWAHEHVGPSPDTNEYPIRAKLDFNTPFESSHQGPHAGDLKTAISLFKTYFVSRKLY